MEIELTPELDGFMEYAISKGLYQNREEAIQSALAMWEERERARLELIAAIEEGENDIQAGEYIDLDSDEAIVEMIEGVKRRGREKLATSDAA